VKEKGGGKVGGKGSFSMRVEGGGASKEGEKRFLGKGTKPFKKKREMREQGEGVKQEKGKKKDIYRQFESGERQKRRNKSPPGGGEGNPTRKK